MAIVPEKEKELAPTTEYRPEDTLLNNVINRRVFIGATMLTISAPLLASVPNLELELLNVTKDGQFFTANELTLLVDIAEIMIPKTDTPGATDAQTTEVLDAMMITWAGTKTKQQFRYCLKQINSLAIQTYNRTYIETAKKTRQLLIEQLDQRAFKNKQSELSKSYRRLKEIIFHIYYTSEQANPNFSLVPGGYRGDLTESELKAINQRGYL